MRTQDFRSQNNRDFTKLLRAALVVTIALLAQGCATVERDPEASMRALQMFAHTYQQVEAINAPNPYAQPQRLPFAAKPAPEYVQPTQYQFQQPVQVQPTQYQFQPIQAPQY